MNLLSVNYYEHEAPISCNTTVYLSFMVHARVFESYINFAFMDTSYHILPVLPIKDLTNKVFKPTTSFKHATGKKTSVSNLCALFCLCAI